MMPAVQSNPIEEAASQLRARGVVLKLTTCGFVVNYRNGKPETDYWTDDLTDALAHGLAMAPAAAPLSPLGPMGKGSPSRRAKMYAHNRKLAAKRRKQENSTKSD